MELRCTSHGVIRTSGALKDPGGVAQKWAEVGPEWAEVDRKWTEVGPAQKWTEVNRLGPTSSSLPAHFVRRTEHPLCKLLRNPNYAVAAAEPAVWCVCDPLRPTSALAWSARISGQIAILVHTAHHTAVYLSFKCLSEHFSGRYIIIIHK